MRVIPASGLAPSSIFCAGKNYEDHAREMLNWDEKRKQSPLREDEPVIFMKPGSALNHLCQTSIPCFDGKPVSGLMHYEAELVVLIAEDAQQISTDEAERCIEGYGVGLDMTLRDVQLHDRQKGNPWLKSKGFRNSAIVSDIIAAEDAGDFRQLFFSLSLNDKTVQQGSAKEMIFNPFHLISYLSWIYGLRRGDLLFTGTPAGVGPVASGDRLRAVLESMHHGKPMQLIQLEATVLEPDTEGHRYPTSKILR